MHKSLVILTIVGIVFGSIIIVWQLIPLLTQEQLKVTWTTEADNYRKEELTGVLVKAVPVEVVDQVLGWVVGDAEKLANHTDFIVHLIDVRVGAALTFWDLSQNGSRFDKRYCWNEELKAKSLENKTAWERWLELEGQAEVPETAVPIKWDFEAVKYYYNPGDPQFGFPDQPDCMIDVLRIEAGGYTDEFRAMFANATVKAEAIASAGDLVVDVQDLREAIATAMWQQYPDRYATLADAQARLDALEAEAGCSQIP